MYLEPNETKTLLVISKQSAQRMHMTGSESNVMCGTLTATIIESAEEPGNGAPSTTFYLALCASLLLKF